MPDLYIQVRVVHRRGETERGIQIEIGDFDMVLPLDAAIQFEEILSKAVTKAIQLSCEKA